MLMKAICDYFNPPPPTTAGLHQGDGTYQHGGGSGPHHRGNDAFAAHGAQYEKLARQRFFAKIMSILCAMATGTSIIVWSIMTSPYWRNWILHDVQRAQNIIYASGFISLIILKALESNIMEKKEQPLADREGPLTYAFLAAFTVAESILASVPCAIMAQLGMQALVLEAFAITAFLFFGLAVFSIQTKYNFTKWAGAGLVVLQALLFWSITGLVFGFNEDMSLIVIGALLFCLFVVIDVQFILYRLGPDDAILGAVTLYLDILNLFLYIMRILAENKGGGGQNNTKRKTPPQATDNQSGVVSDGASQTCARPKYW